MTDYEKDVFLSYRRGQRPVAGGDWPLEPDGQWVHKVFLPMFKHWMENAYPGVRIGFDGDLTPGVEWEPTLQRWVRRSKCMVAVWNPMYFRSKFCRSEFHSMLQRQRDHSATLPSEGPGLVLPVVYADGKWFDSEAQGLQHVKSFSKFSKYSRPIREDEFAHADFVATMQEFCGQVERAIESAPPFSDAFPWCEVDPLLPAHAYPVPRLQ